MFDSFVIQLFDFKFNNELINNVLFVQRIEATEDDDFGDFEGPEDEAPESVQAMGGPPNWVFPGIY